MCRVIRLLVSASLLRLGIVENRLDVFEVLGRQVAYQVDGRILERQAVGTLEGHVLVELVQFQYFCVAMGCSVLRSVDGNTRSLCRVILIF